jgi:hypothetical protein
MIILLISINFLLQSALADMQTTYSWVNKSGKTNTGKCLEMDIDTGGKKYSNQVKNEFCKPDKTDFLFEYSSGECVEVDSKTNGKEFISEVKKEMCKPKKIDFFLGMMANRYGCFEIDPATKGKSYYRKVSEKFCKDENDQIKLFWKSRDGGSGDCYTKPKNSEEMIRVQRDKCKPDKTIFQFKRSGKTRGDCFEQDEKDPLLYSNIVNIENCRPDETIYVFLPNEDKPGGKCYEIDVTTKGNQFIKKVKSTSCK